MHSFEVVGKERQPPEWAAVWMFVLVDSVFDRIKRELRDLRAAPQGAALRTCKPFEKGLSENFI